VSGAWRSDRCCTLGRVAMNRLVRVALQKLVRAGNLTITTARGTTYTLGDGTGDPVALRFTTGAAERGVIFDPELRLGESYMDGTLIVEQGSIADVLAVLQGPTAAHMRLRSAPIASIRPTVASTIPPSAPHC